MTIIEEWQSIKAHDHGSERDSYFDDSAGKWRCKYCPMPVGERIKSRLAKGGTG